MILVDMPTDLSAGITSNPFDSDDSDSSFDTNSESAPSLPPYFKVTLPDDPPIGSLSDEDNSIPEDILAFRTITRMRQLLQKASASIKHTDEKDVLHRETPERRQYLCVNSAIATLAVRDWEIVAVTSHLGSSDLQVIACVYLSDREQDKLTRPALQGTSQPSPRSSTDFCVTADPCDPKDPDNHIADSLTHLGSVDCPDMIKVDSKDVNISLADPISYLIAGW
jgi:hypothetical protein